MQGLFGTIHAKLLKKLTSDICAVMGIMNNMNLGVNYKFKSFTVLLSLILMLLFNLLIQSICYTDKFMYMIIINKFKQMYNLKQHELHKYMERGINLKIKKMFAWEGDRVGASLKQCHAQQI